MNYRQNKNLGFSLIELVLAIAVFSSGSFALAVLLIDANLSAQLSIDRTEALLYAKEGMEATRSIRDNNWSDLADGNHGLNNNGSQWTFNGLSDYLNNKYTRTVSITTVSTSTKDVSVNIQWNLTTSRPVSIGLETLFTNWK